MNFVTISGFLINHPSRSAVSSQIFFSFSGLYRLFGFAQLEVPPLAGKRVHDDEAGVLSDTIQNLEYQLKLHQDSTGNQIAISF